MMVIGLTGGIGMGKSATAQAFAAHGLPVWDADAAVHRLYASGGDAIGPLTARFGDILDQDGRIDRTALSAMVLDDPAALGALEAIVHPLVAQDRAQFLADAADAGHAMVVCDIPLLFEGGGESEFDVIVVATAPEAVRSARVMDRPGMAKEKYAAIVARQTPDAVKRAGADFLVHTDKGLEDGQAQVAMIVDLLAEKIPSPDGANRAT